MTTASAAPLMEELLAGNLDIVAVKSVCAQMCVIVLPGMILSILTNISTQVFINL